MANKISPLSAPLIGHVTMAAQSGSMEAGEVFLVILAGPVLAAAVHTSHPSFEKSGRTPCIIVQHLQWKPHIVSSCLSKSLKPVYIPYEACIESLCSQSRWPFPHFRQLSPRLKSGAGFKISNPPQTENLTATVWAPRRPPNLSTCTLNRHSLKLLHPA